MMLIYPNYVYWAEGVNMAVYLTNRSVCSSFVSKTPEEVWTGKKANVSNFKIFGAFLAEPETVDDTVKMVLIGNVVRYKARLVAKGCSQQSGICPFDF